MVHSEASTGFDDITKNQPSNTWIAWVNAQMLSFPLSRENVLVELGTEVRISVRFGSLFGKRLAPHAFFLQGLTLYTLHDLLSMVSVRRLSLCNLSV